MSSYRTPDDLIANIGGELPAGSVLTGAVVIVSYVVPGEDDEDERGPFMMWCCDGQAGRWTHLGMCEAAANDMRVHLRMREDDD